MDDSEQTMIRVRVLSPICIQGERQERGRIVKIDVDTARMLVANGRAELVDGSDKKILFPSRDRVAPAPGLHSRERGWSV